MKRYIKDDLNELLAKKIVLLMGPRQVGKTTLAQSLEKSYAYYNYDIKKDLKVFLQQEWDRSKNLVVFDELHKMKKWKLWLKSIYDSGATRQQKFLITGSARLDVAQKMGDSLAGRFFSMRLNPLDLKELKNMKVSRASIEDNYKKLLRLGGFPEPFFSGTQKFYGLWAKTHSDLIIKQDLPTLESIRDLDGIELLVELLKERVGSIISNNSLAQDLQRDDKTIKNWLRTLERMYVVFRVPPYSKNLARGLKKASKYYFYDLGAVEGDEGQKLENLVALSLKKEIEFQEDANGISGQLYFAQTKEQKEIDFMVVQKNAPLRLYEVKLSEESVSPNFSLFAKFFKNSEKIQLVRNLSREYTSKTGVNVRSALDYLENM